MFVINFCGRWMTVSRWTRVLVLARLERSHLLSLFRNDRTCENRSIAWSVVQNSSLEEISYVMIYNFVWNTSGCPTPYRLLLRKQGILSTRWSIYDFLRILPNIKCFSNRKHITVHVADTNDDSYRFISRLNNIYVALKTSASIIYLFRSTVAYGRGVVQHYPLDFI